VTRLLSKHLVNNRKFVKSRLNHEKNDENSLGKLTPKT